jgi:quercetin dioxygenase-like cupin family protein
MPTMMSPALMPTTTRDPRTIVNPVIRDRVTFLELSAETGGTRSLAQIELAPGGGNEPHYHRKFDETFTCLQGTLGLQVGKSTLRLEPGQSATAKAGEVHRFFNPSEDRAVTFNVVVAPGSPGFERMLQVAYGLAADGLTNGKGIPKDPYHTALIVRWGDTNMPGLLSLVEPVLRWMAGRAEANGTAQALIDRYCRY